jgi:hypothetical protein
MKNINRWFIYFILIVTSLQLFACAPKATKVEFVPPSKLEPIEGSDIQRVILTEKAAERIDIQTSPVRDEQVNGSERKVVPYAAVIYDLSGATWVYTNPAPLAFVRESITIDFIEGDRAVLVNGPSSGTEVVTVGVAELYGAETGVKK